MKLGLACLVAITVCGCSSGTVDRWADQAVYEARTRPALQYAYASCDGAAAGAPCGLVTDELSRLEHRDGFRARVCSAKTDGECERAFQRYVDARLQERYFAAKWDVVARHCDAQPPKCEDPRVYEELLLASHNGAMRVRRAIAESRIEQERSRMKRQDEAATRRAAQGVLRLTGELAYELHPGPKCRAYPSLSGAFVTLCRDN